ncbi:NF-kappa-B inhibitor-interacting Ras-like protein 1 [Notothenia coriiceps]|uniref:NF-kappa-B inhibitor-interacting Ras-like protein 1 n=1 Tax=Notothenia coriiceps TaxID=8208 RepID=A0A6I9NNH5_9TELE|nr:PREDICTED: NF-kappa-B inhibitor-interacting Ras-like protein 1 [Notothenia coriiceps]
MARCPAQIAVLSEHRSTTPASFTPRLVQAYRSCVGVNEVTVIVLGNKTDLRERRQVEPEAAQQWARGEKVKLWEVSVTERNSLIEPFTQLTSRLTQPQSKSTFPLPGRKSKGTPSNDI